MPLRLGSFNSRTNRNNVRNQNTLDDMARRYMYTSVQQAASDDVAWGKIILSTTECFIQLCRLENAGKSPYAIDHI